MNGIYTASGHSGGSGDGLGPDEASAALQTPSPETLKYIRDHLRILSRMAAAQDQQFLSKLIEIAALEARNIEPRSDQPDS